MLCSQLARLNELEDTVIQQDNQIAALSERIRSLQAEVQKWRAREEATTINLSKEKEKLIEGWSSLLQTINYYIIIMSFNYIAFPEILPH